jgi:hypothetical protein
MLQVENFAVQHISISACLGDESRHHGGPRPSLSLADPSLYRHKLIGYMQSTTHPTDYQPSQSQITQVDMSENPSVGY